jgi:hypothetical protein
VQWKVRFEALELLRLATCALVTLLGWRLVLGWHLDNLTGASDATLYVLFARVLQDQHGDWTHALYTPEVLGGVILHGVYGTPPFVVWGAKLGLAPHSAYNFMALATQTLMAYLATRATLSLQVLFQDQQKRLTLGTSPPIEVMAHWTALPAVFAFLPTLGWRYAQGHMALLWGLLALLSATALLLAVRARQATVVLMLLAILALLHAFQSHGYQIVLYSLVFGTPLLAGLLALRAPDGRCRWWFEAAYVVVPMVLALGLSIPQLAVMIGTLRSSDSLRSAGDMEGYKFLVTTARDWAASIVWTPRWVDGSSPERYAHEVHYALGPCLALLAVVPWKRARVLGFGMLWAVLGAVLFSADVSPVSTLLLHIPGLGAFRVAGRAILPFALLFPIVALAAVLANSPGHSKGSVPVHRAVAIAVAAVTLLCGPAVGEIIAWSTILLVVGAQLSGRLLSGAIPLWVLGCASVQAFSDRLPRLPDASNLQHRPAAIQRAARAQGVSFDSTLERAIVRDEEDGTFGPNAAFFAGLSSVEGYGWPTRRFRDLANATGAGLPEVPNLLVLTPGTETYRVLGCLYNVRTILVAGAGQVRVLRPGPTAGAAWFSRRVELLGSFADLGQRLGQGPGELSERLHEVAWLVASDPVLRARSTGLAPFVECSGAQVAAVDAARGAPAIEVEVVVVDGPCLLTVSTNFIEALRASAEGDGLSSTSVVVPVYGALAAIAVPAGTRRVRLWASR